MNDSSFYRLTPAILCTIKSQTNRRPINNSIKTAGLASRFCLLMVILGFGIAVDLLEVIGVAPIVFSLLLGWEVLAVLHKRYRVPQVLPAIAKNISIAQPLPVLQNRS